MTAPPLPTAAHPATRSSDAGIPRGNIKLEAHAGQLLDARSWRVITQDGETLREGDLIAARLRYALEAPNGRRISIPMLDLHGWLDDFYAPHENKKHQRVALVRDPAEHGLWPGSSIDTIHLQCGDWRILQSDEAVVKISQRHTMPLASLDFRIVKGAVVASYNPTAVARLATETAAGSTPTTYALEEF